MSVGQPTPDRGQEVYEAIQAVARDERLRYLELAALLTEAKDNRYWEGRAESWEEFCATPEISIPAGRARQLIRIHGTYVEGLGFDSEYLRQFSRDTLDRLHKHMKGATPERAENLLEQAAVLGQSDVKVFCRELSGSEVVETDRIQWALDKYNKCVGQIREKLTAEEMMELREHPDRVPL